MEKMTVALASFAVLAASLLFSVSPIVFVLVSALAGILIKALEVKK